MPTYREERLYPIEKIISAATYLTAGGVGFVWLIIAAIMKKNVTRFVMYHIMQSIFFSILCFLVSEFWKLICIIIYKIPLINLIPYLISMPINIFAGLSVVQIFTSIIVVYLAITSFLGYYSYLPYISNIIKGNISGR